jgi:glycosyltransferase involved in cell wall biosynthesis
MGLSGLGASVDALVPADPAMDELASWLEPHARVRRFAYRSTYRRVGRNISAWLDRTAQQRLAMEVAALGSDVIHVNQQVAEDALDLLLAATKAGQPCFSTIHVAHSAAALGARMGRLRDMVTGHVLCRADARFVAVSAASAALLRLRLGERAQHPIETVLNGVPRASATAYAQARAAARSEWGVGDDALVIGGVGRLEPQKAPDRLLDLSLALLKRGVRHDLVWIGDGSLRDEITGSALAAQPPVPLRVDGWRADAATRVAGLDLLVTTSLYEGLPLGLLEAMHAGVPALASPVDGVVEAVEPGITGLLCATPADFVAGAEALARDPALRAKMGRAGSRSAERRFSVEAQARATAQLYERALEGRAALRPSRGPLSGSMRGFA